jgi:hypothetical protein
METPATYKVDRPTLTRKQITSRFGYEDSHPKADVLHSAYFQAVASTADSMIMANALGMTYPMKAKELFREEIDETIELAIAFTDKLIERVSDRCPR